MILTEEIMSHDMILTGEIMSHDMILTEEIMSHVRQMLSTRANSI